ncbi:MAG TPA: hypothetical protein VF278_12940 [Pirellulales bacterium]
MASVDNGGTPGVPDVVLASQYDPAGNRSSLSATIGGTKDFLNSYSYDTLSRLVTMQQVDQNGGNAIVRRPTNAVLQPGLFTGLWPTS